MATTKVKEPLIFAEGDLWTQMLGVRSHSFAEFARACDVPYDRDDETERMVRYRKARAAEEDRRHYGPNVDDSAKYGITRNGRFTFYTKVEIEERTEKEKIGPDGKPVVEEYHPYPQSPDYKSHRTVMVPLDENDEPFHITHHRRNIDEKWMRPLLRLHVTT
jgi:hypothetical protein